MLGGTCTLIGTTTNILVSSIAEQHGIRPFQDVRILDHRPDPAAGRLRHTCCSFGRHVSSRSGSRPRARRRVFPVNRYLSEVIVTLEDSSTRRQVARRGPVWESVSNWRSIGQTRDKRVPTACPDGYGRLLHAGDILLVKASGRLTRASWKAIRRDLNGQTGHAPRRGQPDLGELRPDRGGHRTANSDLDGRTLKGVNFRQRFGATTLAVRRGEDIREKIGRMRLRVGDELLIAAPRREPHRAWANRTAFVILQELDVPVLDARAAP